MKTVENDASVTDFLNNVKNSTRRENANAVAKIMAQISGQKAKMWGPSIIGFGVHHYKYKDGKDGRICKIGFSPRAQSLVFYLGNFPGRDKLYAKMGKHKVSGGGCLYINKLDDIDLAGV